MDQGTFYPGFRLLLSESVHPFSTGAFFMKPQRTLFSLGLLFFLISCSNPSNHNLFNENSTPPVSFKLTTDVSEIANGNNQFGLELYQNLSPKEGNHFFFSL